MNRPEIESKIYELIKGKDLKPIKELLKKKFKKDSFAKLETEQLVSVYEELIQMNSELA